MKLQKTARSEVAEGLKHHFPRLWRYCLVLAGHPDRADDLAQATCLRAIEKADLWAPGTQLDRWTFRIAQRIWLNELRSEAVRRGGGMTTAEDIDLPDGRPNQEMNFFAREVLLEVMALPEAQRTTVVLVYVEGYSYKEAAALLDIPIGTVMSRLAAARAKLVCKLNEPKSQVG